MSEINSSPLRASDFVKTIGVNAHVSWTQYPYNDTSKVISAMDYLGVDNLRDYINSSSFPIFKQLAAAGVKFDLLLNPVVGLNNYIGWAHTLAQTYPGSVVALEGPNEVDNWPVSYNGITGYAGAVATQQALFTAANADPILANVPVYNLTLAGIDSAEYAAIGNVAAYTDFANVHTYYQAGQQSWGYSFSDTRYTLQGYINSGQWSAPGRPTVITETGSTTSPGSAIGVTEDVQAKLPLRLDRQAGGPRPAQPDPDPHHRADQRHLRHQRADLQPDRHALHRLQPAVPGGQWGLRHRRLGRAGHLGPGRAPRHHRADRLGQPGAGRHLRQRRRLRSAGQRQAAADLRQRQPHHPLGDRPSADHRAHAPGAAGRRSRRHRAPARLMRAKTRVPGA
jgi:hypothetical protein